MKIEMLKDLIFLICWGGWIFGLSKWKIYYDNPGNVPNKGRNFNIQ